MSLHEVKSPLGKRLVGMAGVTASLVMLGVSGALNFRYGYTLGASDVEKVGIGLAAVSADVFMAISLFFCLAAWKKKERGKAMAAGVLWISMTAICTWSAVSQMSFNRLEASGDREVTALNFDDLRKEIADARGALGFIPAHRPEATVRAEMDALKTKPLWSQTGECEDGQINGRPAREFCQGFAKLKGELGYAMEATKLRAKIESLIAKSEKATETKGAKVLTEADAGAKTWSQLTGMPVRTAQTIGAALFAYMLLVGTGIGLWTSLGTIREANELARSRREPIDITPSVLPPPMPVREVPISEVFTKREPEPAPEPPKLAAQAPPKVLAPVTPAKARKRPEPNDEARDMLTAIGFPVAPIRGQGLRAKDAREHVAWRFLAWLAAYGLQGSYPAEQVDSLYFEFAQADHREPWGMRVVKNEMESIRYFQRTTPEGRVHWNIQPPSITKLAELLQNTPRKNPVIGRAPKADVDAEEPAPVPVASGGGRGPILKKETSVVPFPQAAPSKS